MATSPQSRRLLVSAGFAALGGTALAMSLAANIATLGDARATAADPLAGAPICHTPAATGLSKMMLRLAQTEVPRAEMSAASAAPDFADTEPPLWDGLGSVAFKITTANEARRPISIRACGWPTRSITARRSAPSARRRSSIPIAPCASGARRWCSVPTSICRCRKTRSRPPTPPRRRRRRLPARQARASRR